MNRPVQETILFGGGAIPFPGHGRPHLIGGLDGGNKTPMLLTVAASIVLPVILVVTNGNIAAGFAVLGAGMVLMLTLYRLDFGFYLLIACVLLFDQFDIPGFDPLTLSAGYFVNLKETSYLEGVEAAVFNPMELQIFLLLFVWFLLLCTRRETPVTSIPLWPPLLALFLWMGVSLVTGLQRGGDFLPALWEIRALFYFALIYMLVPQIITTKSQVRTLVWIIIVTISVKAFQALYRYGKIGLNLSGYPTLTNHEDPVFFTTLFVLALGLGLFGGDRRQLKALLWLLVPLLIAFYVAQRRAAYAACGASFIAFVALLSWKERLHLLKTLGPFLVLFGLYCTVMWNSDSKLASPVKLVKTGFADADDPETAGERFYSNLYRDHEKYNLAVTAQGSPVAGIGFGRKYDMPIDLVFIPFPLRDYIPHNEILWLLVKMGGIGFMLFWLFFDSLVYRGGSVFSRLRDPYLKAVCAVVVIAVINQMVTSYYDLQLTYYRNMVYLGTLAGLLPAIVKADRATVPEEGRP